jgi:heme exporter protein CcmD
VQYAEYVWGCYFLTAGFMGMHLWIAYRDHRKLLEAAKVNVNR